MTTNYSTWSSNQRLNESTACPRLCAIEGIAYAGKTSLSLELKRSGWERLGELAEFHDNGAGFPSFSHTTDHAKKSFRWFVGAEALRLRKVATLVGNNTVSDRCIVSSLAYAYARREVFGIKSSLYEFNLIARGLRKKWLTNKE